MNTSIRPCESDLTLYWDWDPNELYELPYIKHNSNHAMISIERKLFEEVDITTESKIISE